MKKTLTEKENMQLVLDGKRPEWLPAFFDACAFVDYIALGRKEDPKTGLLVDAFGTEFKLTMEGALPAHTKDGHYRLRDVLDWKTIIPQIDLSKIDWEAEANEIRSRFVKEGQMINLNAGYIWEQFDFLLGFDNALVALLLEPEACCECLEAIADFWIDALRRIYKYLKPEIVMMFDHVATHRGMLMSPDTYREIIKPVDKRFIAAIHELGAKAEIHCDGLIEDILPDFAEIGADIIQPFQVFNDINAAKEKYGFVAIGGWDAFGPGNMADATEEEIRQSVRVAMDAYGPSDKYVFWQSGVTACFPRNEKILADEARKYGSTFYCK